MSNVQQAGKFLLRYNLILSQHFNYTFLETKYFYKNICIYHQLHCIKNIKFAINKEILQ